ncbi:hypothetical protein ABLB96_14965 [Acinetobacter sp. XH1741]|uniref:hypothetical protein n=1 Tax=unclassified Acinetobacter TaxID=196816 RepID=UPI0032B3E876
MSQTTRPNCPYCNSKQTRYKSTESGLLTSTYTCKNCGQSFSVNNPVFEQSSNKPKGGCLKWMFKFILYLIIGLIIFAAYVAITDDHPKKDKAKTTLQENSKPNSPKEEFSEEAEKAAHEYIPTEEDYKKHESIADSKNQSDTLHISTTIRNKD